MGAHAFGGAMLWHSSISVTLLESAVAKNAAANPLECALTKLLDLKSRRICSYKKCGWGGIKHAPSVLAEGGRCGGAGDRRLGGVAAESASRGSGRSGICSPQRCMPREW